MEKEVEDIKPPDRLVIHQCPSCGWTYLQQFGGVVLARSVPKGGHTQCDQPGAQERHYRFELIKS